MIELKDVSIRREGRVLFSGASFALHKGQKVGLIGNNGAGKSTLFAVILGEFGVDTGHFDMPEVWQVAHMAQEVHASDATALDYVLCGDDEWWQLNLKLAKQDGLSSDEIAKLHERFADIDGYRTPARASQILSGLGFGEHEHTKCVGEFSGGWRMRLNLARTLMSRADVLLLDEPTNHLDLDAILWLEEWLSTYEGLLIVISHDQAFLDAVTSHSLSIEQGKITLYTGNYSQFVRIRAERLAQEQSAYEKQEATRAHLENFVRRFRAKATKARQAQSRLKQLERMSELAPAMADNPFSFSFYPARALSSPLIALEKGDLGYDVPLLKNVNLHITPETRLGVLGANGAGKSTLIKSLVGKLPLLGGVLTISENLALGYFSQHQMDSLDLEATPMILLRRLAGTTSDADLRSFLGSFNFRGDRIDTPVHLFSGGEKARLTLALIVWQRPNVLILDEPTNHLDLQMQNALTLALQNFDGALVLVSHDRELILAVCDTLMLVADGRAEEFVGDMTDYANHLKKARADRQKSFTPPQASPKATPTKEELRKKNAEIRQKTAPLTKKIGTLESQIDKLSQRLSELETQLSDNALYEDSQKDTLLKLLSEQTDLQKQVATLEDELLGAMDELETLQNELNQ